MSRELICSWLELPAESWPPDHYTLLGLKPEEVDVARVEQRVFERMERVRRYQLTHPEPVTEAMNRLAQALCCLSDPACKRAYDATLFGEAVAQRLAAAMAPPAPVAPPAPIPAPRPAQPAPVEQPVLAEVVFSPPTGPTPSDWQTTPPPARDWQTSPPPPRDWQVAPPPPRTRPGEDTEDVPAAVTETAADLPIMPAAAPAAEEVPIAVPAPEPAEPPSSLPVSLRKGLGTKRALYYRVARTRQLLWAWEHVGKYLADAARPLRGPREGEDLARHLKLVRDLLRSFPPLLGEAGQPGYYVMSLARQPLMLDALSRLGSDHRERFAADWQAGKELLVEHRRFLRNELRSLRQRSIVGRAVRSLRACLADNPGCVLVLLGWLAINLAYPPLQAKWPEQTVVLLVLVGLKTYLWWDKLQGLKPVRLPPQPRPRSTTRRRAKVQRPVS